MAKQKAGDDSTQLNAERDIVIISASASESDIRNLVRNEIQSTLLNYKNDSVEKYLSKGNSMLDKLLGVLGDQKKNLSAFAEPDFNFAIRDAARAVASNDSVYTEDLLVEILATRAKDNKNNKVKIITKQAIQPADKLSEEVLKGLTCLWVMLYIVPHKSDFTFELARSITVYKKIFDKLKPAEPKVWVEEAELLNLITVQRGFNSGTKDFMDYFSERFSKYMCRGIDASRWSEMNTALLSDGVDIRINLLQHPLRDSFVVINHDDRDSFMNALGDITKYSEQAQGLINEAIDLNGFGTIEETAKAKLSELVNNQETLRVARDWWSKLPPLRPTATCKAICFLHARKQIEFDGAQNLESYLMMD